MARRALKMSAARTVIMPIAGRSNDFAGISRSTSSVLMPVHDRSVLQIALEEARDAGAERVVLVTSPGSMAVRRHAQAASSLEVMVVERPTPLGLGDAVLRAAPHVLPGPVGVVLPDDVVLGSAPLVEMTARSRRTSAGHMVAVAEVPRSHLPRHTVIDPMATTPREGLIRAVGIVEKPSLAEAPSSLVVAGRYVLHQRIFQSLARRRAMRAGPLDLTSAIAADIDQLGLAASPITGRWFDCSRPDGLREAAIEARRLRGIAKLAMAAE